MAKIIDNYILIEAIGLGTFGEIHKGRNLISKEAVAVKTIKLERFLNDTLLRDMIINEIQALKKLEDQYIVRMIKMLKSANNIYLVYEFLNGGSLAVYIQEKGRISEQEARSILQGALKGFKTLNHEKIVHRNINPNNLFFNDGVIKIKNFFCCKSPTSQKLFEPENHVYAAPEILLKNQLSQYDDKCDIFSLGLVIYKSIYGQLPFQENISIEELTDIYRNNDFQIHLNDISEQTQQLLNGMLQVDQARRIDWITLLHDEQMPVVPQNTGMSNSNNQNFASNYQINSQVSQQQFDTIGHNFYISQQANLNHVNTSPNELLKRRTTISEKENQKESQKENIKESQKENISTLKQTKDKEELQQFTKTIESVQKTIQNSLLESRNKYNLILQGILKIEQLDCWLSKIKAEICLQLLVKKAIKYINQMLDICQNPDRAWSTSKTKNDMIKQFQKEYDELSQQFRAVKSSSSIHDELSTHEILDENYVDNVLIMIAKQISLELGQVRSSMRSNSQIKDSQRNGSFVEKSHQPLQQYFAIFLIDIVKGTKEEPVNYFKRLEEQGASLEQKLKSI
ncbi:hypothetical protein pb186bvf_009779 [Paramecium bursaria]